MLTWFPMRSCEDSGSCCSKGRKSLKRSASGFILLAVCVCLLMWCSVIVGVVLWRLRVWSSSVVCAFCVPENGPVSEVHMEDYGGSYLSCCRVCPTDDLLLSLGLCFATWQRQDASHGRRGDPQRRSKGASGFGQVLPLTLSLTTFQHTWRALRILFLRTCFCISFVFFMQFKAKSNTCKLIVIQHGHHSYIRRESTKKHKRCWCVWKGNYSRQSARVKSRITLLLLIYFPRVNHLLSFCVYPSVLSAVCFTVFLDYDKCFLWCH